MLLSLVLAQVLAGIPSTGERVVITPTACTAGEFVNAISTSAVGTCAAPTAGSGDLLAANNLSELTATAGTARTNLGLGTLATQSGTFSGTSSGTNTGDQTNITGNAATVTTNANLTGPVTSTGNATAIADGALALAKLANGTAGNVVTYSAAGAITTAATGNSGQVLTSNGAGAAPTFQAAPGAGPTYVLLTANRTNATTSYADITDLVFAVSANTRYDVECKLIYAANATTTGIGIGWTGPASPTLVGGQMAAGLTSATMGGTTSVGNDTGGVTTASVATSGNFANFRGFWSNGANAGNVQMRFKSEVAIAAAIVIQAGSWCKYNTY